MLLLATPVQFFVGQRFYRNSYYGLRVRRLGSAVRAVVPVCVCLCVLRRECRWWVACPEWSNRCMASAVVTSLSPSHALSLAGCHPPYNSISCAPCLGVDAHPSYHCLASGRLQHGHGLSGGACVTPPTPSLTHCHSLIHSLAHPHTHAQHAHINTHHAYTQHAAFLAMDEIASPRLTTSRNLHSISLHIPVIVCHRKATGTSFAYGYSIVSLLVGCADPSYHGKHFFETSGSLITYVRVQVCTRR
jgi:hypothetical protein